MSGSIRTEFLQEYEEDGNSSAISMVHYQTLPPAVDDNEVEDLKYRISQLEHLVVASSLQNTTISSSANPFSSQLTNHGLIQRVSQLEGLLAASELDNRNLNRQIELFQAAQMEVKVDFLEKLRNKDLIVSDLEQNIELLQVKLKKAESKLQAVEEYVHTLPSQAELDEAKYCISQYETENHMLQDKVDRMAVRLNEYQRELAQKETSYNNMLVRLEELKPLEEAQEALLHSQAHLTSDKDIQHMLTVQKAQVLRLGKVIKSLKRKLSEVEEERAELVLQVSEHVAAKDSIQENLFSTRFQKETLEKQLTQCEEKRSQFENQCKILQKRCDENDKLFQLRSQEMGNLIRLVTEINLSVQEMTKLVEFAQNICRGEDPPLDSILGISEIDVDFQIEETLRAGHRRHKKTASDKCDDENDGLSDSDSEIDSEFDVDVEWILEKLKQVRDLRREMSNVSSRVSDMYSDMLSGSVSGCGVQ